MSPTADHRPSAQSELSPATAGQVVPLSKAAGPKNSRHALGAPAEVVHAQRILELLPAEPSTAKATRTIAIEKVSDDQLARLELLAEQLGNIATRRIAPSGICLSVIESLNLLRRVERRLGLHEIPALILDTGALGLEQAGEVMRHAVHDGSSEFRATKENLDKSLRGWTQPIPFVVRGARPSSVGIDIRLLLPLLPKDLAPKNFGELLEALRVPILIDRTTSTLPGNPVRSTNGEANNLLKQVIVEEFAQEMRGASLSALQKRAPGFTAEMRTMLGEFATLAERVECLRLLAEAARKQKLPSARALSPTEQLRALLTHGIELFESGLTPHVQMIRGEFFLTIDGSKVCQYFSGEKEQVFVVSSSSTKHPLAISSTKIQLPSLIFDAAGIGDGDFVLEDGTPLFGIAQYEAASMFERVRKGIKLFALEGGGVRSESGASEGEGEAKEWASSQRRHWGQAFLATLQPQQVLPGYIFPDGENALAYVFKNVVIVESNVEAHATVWFSHEAWGEQLQDPLSRAEILAEPRPGIGRIVHRGRGLTARNEWKEEVRRILKGPKAK